MEKHFIGSGLRRLREERGLSKRALSRSAGLTLRAVTLLEADAREPSASTLLALARALGVSVSAFFPEEDRGG